VGVIDTLTAGFDLVRKRPWLILLPVALDVGLWVAPKLSFLSLMRGVVSDTMATAASVGQETLPALQEQGELLLEFAERTNVLSLLTASYPGVPSLPVESTSFFGLTRQVIELQSGLALVGLMGALLLAGVLIAALYLGLIAQTARDEQVDWRRFLAQVPRYWLRLVGAGLVIGLALLLLGLPAGLFIGFLALLSPGLASLFLGVISFMAFWLLIYMAFVPVAILFSDDGVAKAIWRSAMLVRSSFWPALGLFLLIYVISVGLLYVWEGLAVTAPGAMLAIVANAFVGTGLMAAVFVFYRERLQAPVATAESQRS
jgi:hypothetical protein